MKSQFISAAVVLSLGLAGIALAQHKDDRQGSRQIKDRPEEQAHERAQLRSRVVKLRAEVEFLQLEHEVDADLLRKLMTDMKNLDNLEAVKAPMKEQMEAQKGRRPDPAGDVPILPGLQGLTGKGGDQDLDSMFALNGMTARMARPIYDRMRKDFVRKAAELNEKRLELAELEERYNEAH